MTSEVESLQDVAQALQSIYEFCDWIEMDAIETDASRNAGKLQPDFRKVNMGDVRKAVRHVKLNAHASLTYLDDRKEP